MPPLAPSGGKILTAARLRVGRGASLGAMSVIIAFAVLAESGIGMSLVSDRTFSKERTAAAVAAAIFGGLVGEAALLARSIRHQPSGDAVLAWERT